MRRPSVTMGLVAVALAGCSGSPQPTPAPDEAVLLRLAPPAGQVSHYRTVEQSVFDVSMPMLEGPVATEQIRYQTHRVLEAAGDRRVIERTIDSLIVDASDAPGMFGASMQEAARTVRGQRDTFAVDVMAHVVEEADASPKQAMEGPAPGLDPSGLFDLLEHPMGLPEGPVRPGDSWTVPVERRERIPELGVMVIRVEATYLLDSVAVAQGARHAAVSYDATMSFFLEADPSAMVEMSMEFDGTDTGELVLDVDAGRVVHATATAVVDGAVAAMGMDILMSMEIVAERVLLTKDPS